MATEIDGDGGLKAGSGGVWPFFAWAAAGFVLVPFGPQAWGFLAVALGSGSSLVAPMVVVVAGCAGWAVILRSGRDVAWRSVEFVAPLVIAASVILVRSEFPAERFHVVQFAILSGLAGWAWGGRFRPVAWIAIAAFFGVMDEAFQAMIVTRTFSWIDMGVNVGGACLGGAAWVGLHPDRLRGVRTIPRFATSVGWSLAAAMSTVLCIFRPWEPVRPPVILITVDSLRADTLRPDVMPFVCELADSGLRFDAAYAVAPWTSPNLVSLHTGLLPAVHGVRAREATLDPHVPTIARVLRRAGYRAPDLLSIGADPGFRELGLEPVKISGGSVEGAVTAWLAEFGGGGDPLFLWLHLVDVHLPYELDPGVQSTDAVGIVTGEMLIPDGSLVLDEADSSRVAHCYEAGAKSVDQVVKAVAEGLSDLGLWDQSLVIVTADHGEELGERGNVGHASTTGRATLFEEVLRIPLVARWPGVLPAGLRIETPVQLTDVFPSICEWLDLGTPGDMDGWVLPTGEVNASRLLLFESNRAGYQDASSAVHRWRTGGILDGRKAIFDEDTGRGRVYDLRTDPGERTPLHLDETGAPAWAIALAATVRSAMTQADERRVSVDLDRSTGAADGATLAVGCPEIRTPGYGAVLDWRKTDRIVLEWSGSTDANYALEYDIGSDEYRLSGTLEFSGVRQEFGPFTVETWERLATYAPWRFRVWPMGDPACASEWFEFSLKGDSS